MLPTIKGRPKDLDVRKTWTSERPGRPKDLDVQKTWMSGDLDVLGPGSPKDLDVQKTYLPHLAPTR